MSHVHVTSHAAVQVHLAGRGRRHTQGSVGGNRIDHLCVAAKAIVLQHFGVGRHNADWLREVLQSECLGVAIAVARLDVEFVDDVVLRQMAIVANLSLVEMPP